MTDHLPECHMRHGLAATAPCICPALRACEQRVRDEGQRILIKHGAQQFVRGEEIGKAMGYAAGLSAARDAVAAVETYMHFPFESPAPALDGETGVWIVRGQALAAIDALRANA